MTITAGGPEVGQTDPMSEAAARCRVPLCGYRGCTRAAGHDEIVKNNSTALLHVVADASFTIREVMYR